MSERARREIEHGRRLAAAHAEERWGWGTPAGLARARRRAAWISQAAGLGPGVRALEIGCGTGLLTEMFAQSGAHVLAVDVSPDLLGEARARRLPEDRVVFLEADFEDAAIQGGFDAVIGSSVLHHLELEPALRRIHALLKPFGIMSFAEPNMLNPQVFLMKRLPRFFPSEAPGETAFLGWGLRRHLREAGFADIAVTPRDWLHPVVPRPLIPLWAALGGLLERTPLARHLAGSLYIRAVRP